LKITDEVALDLHNVDGGWAPRHWHTFQDFLDSDDPLALDERRYAVAALACLKILFGHHQLWLSDWGNNPHIFFIDAPKNLLPPGCAQDIFSARNYILVVPQNISVP